MWTVVGAVAIGTIGSMLVGQAGRRRPAPGRGSRTPRISVAPVSICVTKGALLAGGRVEDPTFRGVAVGTSGQAAAIVFSYEGPSRGTRALGSGQIRRQIGLKLKAQDGCNLVYAMWRLDPRPRIEVSTKINPGSRTHAECGTRGYAKVNPDYQGNVPALSPGEQHWMQAEIVDDALAVWVDGQLAWQGQIPAQARYVDGPSGMRSDNIGYRILGFYAPRTRSAGSMSFECVHGGED